MKLHRLGLVAFPLYVIGGLGLAYYYFPAARPNVTALGAAILFMLLAVWFIAEVLRSLDND